MAAEKFGDELVLVLRQPVVLGTLEFRELTLREPRGEALQLADAEDAMGAIFVKISRTAGVSPAVAKRMLHRDLQRAADFFASFGNLASTEVYEDSLVLDLFEPIEFDVKTITSLTLTEPNGEALQMADREVGWAEVCSLIASTAAVSRDLVKKMRQRDLQRARNFFAHFSAESFSKPSEITPQS